MRWRRNSDGVMLVEREEGQVTDFANYIDEEGEIYHVQNVGRILAHCSELRKDPGWSKPRTLKRAASIPLIEFLKHPALAELQTNEEIDKYIAKYLPQYANAHETRGILTPNIIVK